MDDKKINMSVSGGVLVDKFLLKHSSIEETKIYVPVSVGELVDKFSILDIKLEKIKDPIKKKYVQEEYDELKEQAEKYINEYPHYYTYIKDINEEIWNLSDYIRDNPNDNKACTDIIHHNDRRFRVKNKFNQRSTIKEQKGYPNKKVIFIGHEGSGDYLTIVGLIRYLSTCFDRVKILVKPQNVKINEHLYEDDNNIECMVDDRIVLKDLLNNLMVIDELKKENPGWEIISVGFAGEKSEVDYGYFFDSFYIGSNVPTYARFKYNYIPRNKERRIRSL